MANLESGRSEHEHDDRAPNDQERELYERARNAANEAVREGNAQLKAAMAAAGAPRQCAGTPTRMNRWSLIFTCSRLEAAYRRKSTTNTDNCDYIPIMFKIAMSVPHFCQALNRIASRRNLLSETSRSLREFFVCELWATWAAVFCLAVLAVQLKYPQWYKSNRGATLKYFVMLLWAWESVRLYLNTDEFKYILLEVVFVNVYMSFLHRVPFISHLQSRSIGCGEQVVAIISKGLDFRRTLQVMFVSVVTHSIGLIIAYCFDRSARRQFLKSLPVWLLDEINGSSARPQFYLSYRASLSRQLWSIFYPELLENPEPATGNKAVTYEQIMAPRRALGGFAGGFGGVSSLKCTGPVSNSPSPLSSSSSLSGRTSDSSSGHWAGVGLTESGLSCGEIVSNGHDSTGYQRREFATWAPYVTTSACSQVGMDDTQPHYMRSRGLRAAAADKTEYCY
ncbi:hypothetical protein Mapa_010160 [Marchantia paleacea]|nr:hypothetical protein Mapa_010160 [Marchantia paleacea]